MPEPLVLKQVVAVIDKRTSPVCLHAAGQIRKIEETFDTLLGEQSEPPFHEHCRSMVVPWMVGMVSDVRKQANAELLTRPLKQRRIGPNGETGPLPPKVPVGPKPAPPAPAPAWTTESARDRVQSSLTVWQQKDATWRTAADAAPSSEAKAAWKSYGSNSDSMNGYLRGWNDSPVGAQRVQAFDGFIEQFGYVVEQDMTVSRYVGGRLGAWDPVEAYPVGDMVREAAYTSTTALPMEGNGGTWILQIRVPAGMKVVHGTAFESEMVLPHGTGFRVIRRDDALREIWIEAVPPTGGA